MGNSHSDQVVSFLNKNTFKRLYHHPELGDAKLYEMNYQKGCYILLSELLFQTNEELEKFRKIYHEANFIKNDTLIELNAIFEESKIWNCGNQAKAYIFFEFLHQSLSKEIKNRMKNKEFFSEEEVWFILDSIIILFSEYEKKKYFPSDISSSKFFFTKDGHLKFLDTTLIMFVLKKKEERELNVPTTQENLINELFEVNKVKVLEIGIILLEICTLESVYKCFYANTREVNFEEISNFLPKIERVYSQDFCALLKMMLIQNQQKRISFNGMLSYLNDLRNKKEEIENKTNIRKEKIRNFKFMEENLQERNILNDKDLDLEMMLRPIICKSLDYRDDTEDEFENPRILALELKMREALKYSKETIEKCGGMDHNLH